MLGHDGRARLRTSAPTRVLAELCGWAAERGLELERLEVLRPSLEQTYLDIVGEPAAEPPAEADTAPARSQGRRGAQMRMLVAQLRSDLKVFVRNPAALFFTAILPVVFLCLFVSIFGNERAGEEFGNVRISTLQVPAFIALAVVSASFVGLAIGLVSVREAGVLKRVRGTPAPPWIVFAGRIGTAIVSATIVTTLLIAIGAIAFGVRVPTATLPGLVAALAVGAFAFCALGIAYTRAISSEDAAPAMTNAVVLPLYFISGVFVPVSQLPGGPAPRR